jgi:pimeloyl-ACP methyl ester carboxylesterase
MPAIPSTFLPVRADGMKETIRTVKNGSLTLNCVCWGADDAPAVLLLHGLRAYAHWFDEFAAAAHDRYRLIGLDQRGRGASGWALDRRYDTDSYVADIECVADALHLERFAVVGHSMGGTNATNYAASHPDRVSALIIVDSAPELNQVGLDRIRRELSVTPKGFPNRDAARSFLRTMHVRASDQSIETRLDWMLMTDSSGAMTWRIDPAIFDPKMTPDSPERSWNALKKVTCPTLVVRAALSDLVTADCADRMVHALASGFRAEVAEAAHMIVEDNPAGFNAAVLPFLDRVLHAHLDAVDRTKGPVKQPRLDWA